MNNNNYYISQQLNQPTEYYKTESNTITMPPITVVYPHAANIFAATCACIFIVVGIFGNLLTIIALIRNPKLRGHATTAFVLSLCFSDLLFCSFSLPLTAIRYINEAWTLGENLCRIFPVIFYSNVAISVLSMVGITLNRYILIAYNHMYARFYSRSSIFTQLFLIWTFAFSIMMVPFFGLWGQLGLNETTFSCTILEKDGRSMKKFFFLIGFVIPCLIIIGSYTCIYSTVRRQRQKLQKYNITTTDGEHTAGQQREREDNRLTIMMLTIFACFMLCFLPLMLVNVVDDQNNYPWLHICGSILAWASSVINPFIYAASNRTYRVAYYKLFSTMKFWGQPMSPMPSKSFVPSKGSKGDDDGSNNRSNQSLNSTSKNKMTNNTMITNATATIISMPTGQLDDDEKNIDTNEESTVNLPKTVGFQSNGIIDV